MGQRKRLDTLPEVKAYLDKLIQQGVFTQKQLSELATEYAKELGHDAPITEKVVNRYMGTFKDIMEKRDERALVVKQWIARMGDVPDGDFGRVLIEIMRQLAFDMNMSLVDALANGAELPESIKMLNNLTACVQKLESSASENEKRDAALKKAAAEEANLKAADNVEKAATQMGLSAEQVQFWREQVLLGS